MDIKFNLLDENCSPYIKANGKLEYVPVGSNHPPKVVKNIPFGVEKRLCCISSDKESFDGAKATYQQALIRAGHKHILNFQIQDAGENIELGQNSDVSISSSETPTNSVIIQTPINNKVRKRNIIWFNVQ